MLRGGALCVDGRMHSTTSTDTWLLSPASSVIRLDATEFSAALSDATIVAAVTAAVHGRWQRVGTIDVDGRLDLFERAPATAIPRTRQPDERLVTV